VVPAPPLGFADLAVDSRGLGSENELLPNDGAADGGRLADISWLCRRAVARAVAQVPNRRAFWVVAFAYLAVMAFSTVPSLLYGLYRARDHFSLFMVTVIYAVYAVGVIGELLLAGHLSDWHGRRRLLLPSLAIAILSAVGFLASKSLAAQVVARLIDGISVGMVASAATAGLASQHQLSLPRGGHQHRKDVRRSRDLSTGSEQAEPLAAPAPLPRRDGH
jgi:hypothetical protein